MPTAFGDTPPPGTVIVDRRSDAAKNPAWRAAVETGFLRAAFVRENGIRLGDCGPGWCEASVELTPHHLQETGVPHVGMLATLASHTALAAAVSTAAPDEQLLTAEFKLSLLRTLPAKRLHCRADVVKPGSSISFVESSVEAEMEGGDRKLVARASVTLSVSKEGPQ